MNTRFYFFENKTLSVIKNKRKMEKLAWNEKKKQVRINRFDCIWSEENNQDNVDNTYLKMALNKRFYLMQNISQQRNVMPNGKNINIISIIETLAQAVWPHTVHKIRDDDAVFLWFFWIICNETKFTVVTIFVSFYSLDFN